MADGDGDGETLSGGLARMLGFGLSARAAVLDQASGMQAGTVFSAAVRDDRAEIARICGADEAAWLQRDPAGATLFHLAYLLGNEPLARWLAGRCPALVAAAYSAGPYEGENALHIAIVKQCRPEAVRWLVRACPALVQGRATGAAFHSSRALFPFGELPLSFAVSINDAALVRLLVEEGGADLRGRCGPEGNSAMHLAVLHRRRECMALLEALWGSVQALRRRRKALFGSCRRPDAALPGAAALQALVPGGAPPPDYDEAEVPLGATLYESVNLEGFTPHILAAKLGDFPLFVDMWRKHRRPVWEFAHTRNDLYPLRGIDDVADLVEFGDGNAGSGAGAGAGASAGASAGAGAGAGGAGGVLASGRAHATTAFELLTFDDNAGAVMRERAIKKLMDWCVRARKHTSRARARADERSSECTSARARSLLASSRLCFAFFISPQLPPFPPPRLLEVSGSTTRAASSCSASSSSSSSCSCRRCSSPCARR